LRYINNKEFWAITAAFVILLAGVHFFAGHVPEDSLLSKGIHFLYAPAYRSADKVSLWLEDYHYVLAQKQELEQQLADTKEQLDAYKLKSLAWEENRLEFVRLQAILDLSSQYLDDLQFLTARVIARSPNTWDQFIMIDKGTEHGVTLNMPVITPDGLVGLVMNATSKTAQVYLLTDREIAVGVVVQSSREGRGIVEGMGSPYELKMGNIPYYSEIQAGDIVVTSGLSEIYPKGIKVGTVKELHQEGNGLVITAAIEPAVDFDRLEEVMLPQGYPQDMDFSLEPVAPVLEDTPLEPEQPL
jgi:rod shape-determining protein MreC